MNKIQFDFINKVSDRVIFLSQFPTEVCDWIGCQFALESSYGESSLAKDYQNYCGMRNPMIRISTAIHVGDADYHWAHYADLDTCIIDYLLCLQYHCPISTDYDSIHHFARFIRKFYCPDGDYIPKIHIIYSQFKNLQK